MEEYIGWYCDVCGKSDYTETERPMAGPEHVPYRGIDIGSCKGLMKLFTLSDAVEEAAKDSPQ